MWRCVGRVASMSGIVASDVSLWRLSASNDREKAAVQDLRHCRAKQRCFQPFSAYTPPR